jgi:hypothetical protein
MKKIVPWRDNRDHLVHPISSLPIGAASVAIGLAGTVLVVSYFMEEPIGPQAFYDVANVSAEVNDVRNSASKPAAAEHIVPSVGLLLPLILGAFWGGFRVYYSRNEAGRMPAAMSVAGLLLCSTSLALSCFLYAWAYV